MFGARTEIQTLSRYVTAAKARRNPPARYRTRVGCIMEARIFAVPRLLHYGLVNQGSCGTIQPEACSPSACHPRLPTLCGPSPARLTHNDSWCKQYMLVRRCRCADAIQKQFRSLAPNQQVLFVDRGERNAKQIRIPNVPCADDGNLRGNSNAGVKSRIECSHGEIGRASCRERV